MSARRPSGAARIFRYNWPVYAATWGAAVCSLGVAMRLSAPWGWLAASAAAAALAWSLASLVVSFYVYDASGLVGGRWVPALVGPRALDWTMVHAGLDAEIDLDDVMPGTCVGRLDVFDPTLMSAPSIARARAITPRERPATRCRPDALALADGSCDAIVVAFSAHEIRDPRAREAFFVEARRCLRPGGRMLLVEHVRDAANFAAFGPGYRHFLPRAEWLRLAAHANLVIACETRVTPWVMALALEKAS